MSQDVSQLDASILVPVFNEAEHLVETVRAMRRQRFAGDFEVLLIDGRSDDGTRAIAERLSAGDPSIRVLDNQQRSIPHALNVGLRHARGRFIVRMDAHTYYPPDYIERGVARLRRGDVAWVSGPQVPYGRTSGSRRVALALSTPFGTGASAKWGWAADRQSSGREELELSTGVFCGVWRRETLTALGGWDEAWPINEDAELAARVLASGGRIVCLPELAARYVPRDRLWRLARQYWRYGHYRAKTVRRHPTTLRPSHLLPPAVAGSLALAVAGPARRPARLGAFLYGMALVGSAARAARRAPPSTAAALPAVFATMHLAWGAGFLAGCVRFVVHRR